MHISYLCILYITAVAVEAQFANAPPCVVNCVMPAATQSGCALTQTTCICSSSIFQSVARACLQAKCTPAEVQGALAMQNQQCASAGISSNTMASISGAPNSTTMISPSPTANLAASSSAANSADSHLSTFGIMRGAVSTFAGLFITVMMLGCI